MKIIIVGDGKVGRAITAQLSKEGHDLTIIDSNPSVLEKSMQRYDVMVIHGNGASMPVLQRADADAADLLIAATSADEINMLTCIVAKKIGTKNTIARIRTPEYFDQLIMMREELGLSMPINPELSAATEIYNTLQLPSFLHRDSFIKGKVEIVELKVLENSKLQDLPLMKLSKVLSAKVLICAVERKGEAFIPSGNFVLQKDDRIHITADAKDLAKVIHDLDLKKRKVRNVMIIGGSRIAYYLSHMLLLSGISVKIVDKNSTRCLQLAEQLPKAMVIEGEGSNQQLLLEEGLQDTDALVTLTNMDEENIFLSLYGAHLGVPHIITKVNQTEYASIIEEMGIESAVSPKKLCATEVVRYVRAMANTTGGSVLTMHEIVNGKVHALEFQVTGKTKYLDKTLIELPIKKSILVACIFRRGKTTIPDGKTRLKKGDSIIIVTPSDYSIIDLNDIFEN